jgi:flagellar biosynthesis regulator FlbT
MTSTKTAKSPSQRKRNFSSFSYKDAFKQLNITRLQSWHPEFVNIQPSEFFQQHLKRLQHFDLTTSEEAKKLIIDAVLAEAIQGFERLKIWKAAALESDLLQGQADYLIAENRAYLEAPLLCIIEAKKDDFEQGLAQCLVEMQACQWNNQQLARVIDVLGIVTNGEGWKFYQLTTTGIAYESLLYSLSDVPSVLGILHIIFRQCEQQLSS